jgi:hypothetical protein
MTPPVATISEPQQHVVDVFHGIKRPHTTVFSIDVADQALAELGINDKNNEEMNKIYESIKDDPNNKPNDEINDKSIANIDDNLNKKSDQKIDKAHYLSANGKILIRRAPNTIPGMPLLFHPYLVTGKMDLLRVEGAAYAQLAFHSRDQAWFIPDSHFSAEYDEATSWEQPMSYGTSVLSSPYNAPLHLLDLADEHLSMESRFFAIALTALKPTGEGYATAPYTEALNFDTVMDVLRSYVQDFRYEWKETFFYVVVFRSQLKEDIDENYLYQLDEMSHREACFSGGLLKYWFGKKDSERRNLATCKLPFTSFHHLRKTTVN